jgi:amino acid adenylation domain-containing protein
MFAREHVTLFTGLLTALKAVLAHYTGQEDVIVGSLSSDSRWALDDAHSDVFVNPVALRTNLADDPPVSVLLRRVSRTVEDAAKHRDYPFETLIEILHAAGVDSKTLIFQVMFILCNAPCCLSEMPSSEADIAAIGEYAAQCDVVVVVSEADGRLGIDCEYDAELFEPETIRRLIGHLQTVVMAMANDPQQRLSALLLLTVTERHQLLVDWDHTVVDYDLDVCLHQLFEAQVKRTPDAIALTFDDAKLTYAELNEQANQVAHYLRRLGVGPDVLVGLFMERSLEMVVGLYGVLKAGGAYVPMDPEYPSARLAFMIQDTQVPVLLTQARLVAGLPEHYAHVICLDADWAAIAQERTENPDSGVTAEHLAYVIYTSGSTGQPKGVMNTHRGICNRLLWMQDTYALTSDDRVLQKTPFSFDVSVWEFFWPLLVGARLVVAQPGGHRDNAYLIELIVSQAITTIHFVPSMLQVFLAAKDVETCQSLRRVICSGEALPYDLQMRFFARLKAELHNLYGPTEAAIDVTYWACQQSGEHTVVPIGRPVANTQIYILNDYLQPVPIRVPGELHIGGVQVARGYLNRPELTEERFIRDPFCADVHARLYKTGDLARYLPDGNIEFLGRIDQQVKIRGFRVELGEIETVLAQHADVRESVVILREDPPGEHRLVAYVVPRQPYHVLVARELQRFLREQLPNYMVPAEFVSLEAMPLTPNGKVDRQALPVPEGQRTPLHQAYLMPQSEAERLIADVWREVLQVEAFGLHDNFFDLGGHSLLLARVQGNLQEIFGHTFSMTELFQHPTISSLAQYVTQKTHAALLPAARGVASRQTSPPAPGDTAIAIIGMGGRFPGAPNLETFWSNLRESVESV